MSNYTQSTSFGPKDNLDTGNALKRLRGAELDDEFGDIATAIATKANTNNTVLTGTPTAPTASAATNNTQIATTAYTTSAITTAVNAIPDAGIGSVLVDSAAGAIGKDIYINTSAPVQSDGNTGDIWFEY